MIQATKHCTRFSIAYVGALLRGEFRSELRSSCHMVGVDLELHEEKGWLSSSFWGSLTGTDDAVGQIRSWIESLQDEGHSGP